MYAACTEIKPVCNAYKTFIEKHKLVQHRTISNTHKQYNRIVPSLASLAALLPLEDLAFSWWGKKKAEQKENDETLVWIKKYYN